MRLGGTARYECDVSSEDELLEALSYADKMRVPIRVIGSGSNIIWRDEGFSGLLIVNKIEGYEILEDVISFGSGVEWDKAVQISVEAGYSGLENLSLIPGTVGATPIQNVGAYGREVSDTLQFVRAYDTHEKTFVKLPNEKCFFAYRTSRFKTTDSGRFIITNVSFRLNKRPPYPPFYESLQKFLDDNNINSYTPQIIRDAVIAIRSSKLPDPKKIANNGSFFANPIIEAPLYEKLKQSYPDIKAWPLPDGKIKLAAGWLIECSGFKDSHDSATGMATWHNQNLVLVNEHATSTQQLLDFKQKIVTAVYNMFGVTLEQEPELLP